MTARTRDQLKSKFETDDIPPEADWIDLIDSFVLITEGFITDLDALVVDDGDAVTET